MNSPSDRHVSGLTDNYTVRLRIDLLCVSNRLDSNNFHALVRQTIQRYSDADGRAPTAAQEDAEAGQSPGPEFSQPSNAYTHGTGMLHRYEIRSGAAIDRCV
jgi:hypothetical protein